MLTGDNRTTAQAVARRLGIDDVVADVLPDQKVDAVKRLQAEGRFVAHGRRWHQRRRRPSAGHRSDRDGTGTDVGGECRGDAREGPT